MSKISRKISLNVWSYFLEIASLLRTTKILLLYPMHKAKPFSQSQLDPHKLCILCNTWSCIVVYQASGLCAVFCRVYQFYFSRSRNLHLCIFIYISICMSCDSDWFFPVFYMAQMPFTTIGARNTVPSSIARIVPFDSSTFLSNHIFHMCRIR